VGLLNAWQFDDLLLRTDLSLGLLPDRYIVGGEAGLNYLFSRSNFSPFLGGGFGLFYGPVDDASGGKRNTGPSVNVQGGLLLFRTYDVNFMLRGKYLAIFNSDRDHGIIIDGGVTYAFQTPLGK
jgi:hypothetical protein